MEKPRTIAIGEDVWARLKQRALDERVTLREVVERAAGQYLGAVPVLLGRRRGAEQKHWTPEDGQ